MLHSRSFGFIDREHIEVGIQENQLSNTERLYEVDGAHLSSDPLRIGDHVAFDLHVYNMPSLISVAP